MSTRNSFAATTQKSISYYNLIIFNYFLPLVSPQTAHYGVLDSLSLQNYFISFFLNLTLYIPSYNIT